MNGSYTDCRFLLLYYRMLKGKKILLGITGSIAAYKAILLTRLFIKAGAEVKIIMTPASREFVPVLTLSALSKNKVLTNLADEEQWANHVMLGRWADVMLIAPLSCNTLAKMANGICDNLLMATYLSAVCPVVVAPAMDEDMWMHSSTKRNIDSIIAYGYKVVSVTKGDLASGLYGEGRMAEPESIFTFLEEQFFRGNELKGKKVLVSAGPTYEAIDPVRFIGNHSSGKMGYAIAEEFYMRGAEVELVSGPSTMQATYNGIRITRVNTAAELYEACTTKFRETDVAIMAAAVADYTPQEVSASKIKKSADTITLTLKRTTDILKHLGESKRSDQVVVGFALETNNEKENAISKLKNKNADLIVLNSLQDDEAGFGKDTNKVTIFDKDGKEYEYSAKSKKEVASDIVEVIVKKLRLLS